ncbi:Sodium- and chloride-dependent GABA transporter 2, partial [Orchesella cincta]
MMTRKSVSQSHISQTPSYYSGSQSGSESGISDEDESPEEDTKSSTKCGAFCENLQHIDATNLTLSPLGAGIWDEWGVYYCNSRFGRHTRFNPDYFSLAAIFIVGQSNFFNLIDLMQEHGGSAFLIVLFMTYMSFGYPTYLLETLMGQYSGRKPILMIRHLMPILQGLGIALYIRTLIRAVNSLSNFAYCLYHCWDLLFCKASQSVLLKRFLSREREPIHLRLLKAIPGPIIRMILIFACFVKLSDLAAGMKVVLRLLLLFLFGYTFNGYLRTNPKQLQENSIVYLPLRTTFAPKWEKIVDGRVWVQAIIFVVHSLELGTLVHPYLGSKTFFHYRTARDGVLLILVAITWNLIGAVGVLLWLGYVGINKTEIEASLKQLKGHYGIHIVFILKHIQAELTQQVEGDVLFFCAIFYMIVGIAALLAGVAYLYVMIDSTYSESGHPLLKLCIMMFYVFAYPTIAFPLMLAFDGMRNIVFVHFFLANSWVGLFLIILYTSAVAWSQGMARILHDFYNMLHLKGYEVRTHFYQIPKLVPFLFVGFLTFAMIQDLIERYHPNEGSTDWLDPMTMVIGHLLSLLPIFAVCFGAVYYLVKERKDNYAVKSKPLSEPHRDFYKNKHHTDVCFKDYEFFNYGSGKRKSDRSKEATVEETS